MKAHSSKARHTFALLRPVWRTASITIIENKAEDLLFKHQVNIAIRIRDMAMH